MRHLLGPAEFPTGMRPTSARSRSLPGGTFSRSMSVSIGPGAIAFTVIPRGPSSSAHTLVMAAKAAFDAA